MGLHNPQAEYGLPAILGGTAVRPFDREEPMPHPGMVDEREADAVAEVVWSGHWSGGDWHDRAKRLLTDITGAPYVSLCTNGTHALQLANAALGVEAWKRVFVPGTTWTATAGSILELGGVPVMIDIDRSTLTVSVDWARDELERRWREGDVMPTVVWVVALYSRLPNLRAFRELVDEFSTRTGQKIYLGLDHAHGPGGLYETRPLIEWVDVITVSGQESKNAKAGEAGAICVKDRELHRQIESRINCGRPPAGMQEGWQSSQYRHATLATAAWCGQLERYRDDWLPTLQRNSHRLDKALRAVDGVEPMGEQPGALSQVYKYAFRITVDLPIAVFLRALEAELGYEVRGQYPPLNQRDGRNPYYPEKAPNAGLHAAYRRLITVLPELPVSVAAFGEVAAIEWAFVLRDDCPELLATAIRKIVAHAPAIREAYERGGSEALAYWFDW